MKRFTILLTFFLFSASLLIAQDDSVLVTNARWETRTVAPGITWKHYHFTNLFNSDQNINIIEIKKSHRYQLAFGYEPVVLKPTSVFGRENNALAAINGTFFDVKNGGSVDYLKVNGQVIHENRLLKNGNRARHQQAALLIRKGRLRIAKWNGSADWEQQLPEKDIMLTGPLLVWQNRPATLDSSAFNTARHPRSALAVAGNNRVWLITVDGRNANAAGMSLFELSKVLYWLKARAGINLDGGGSTTLWIHNQPGNGVVNYPSDNKKWDHEGERKVANVVLVKQR